MFVSRKLWIDAGATDHVEGSVDLWEELSPQGMEYSVITTIDDGDEVSFEGMDDPIGKVVTVILGIAELALDVFLCDGAAEEVRNFIVKTL